MIERPALAEMPRTGQGDGVVGPSHRNWVATAVPDRDGTLGIGTGAVAMPCTVLETALTVKNPLLASTHRSAPSTRIGETRPCAAKARWPTVWGGAAVQVSA